MNIKTFEYQFPGMRKPDKFVVYPRKVEDRGCCVQGRRTIACILISSFW